MDRIRKEYTLSYETCDEIAKEIMAFSEKIGGDRRESVQVRLSAEECLAHWLENGHEGEKIVFRAGTHLLMPVILLDLDGPADNPITQGTVNLGHYLSVFQLKPEFYHDGKRNRILFRLRRKSMSPMAMLAAILLAGVAVGMLGMLMPEGTRQMLLEELVKPLYNTFFRALGIIAGPIIFLSVIRGICGIESVDAFGRIGKKLILRYLLIVLLAGCFAAMAFPILGPGFSNEPGTTGKLSDITNLILNIVPGSLVAPFAEGNMLQIMLLAILIGIGLLYLGKKTQGIQRGVEQASTLVTFLMQLITKFVPFTIFLIVVELIWSGTLASAAELWKLLAVHLAMAAIVTIVFITVVSVRHKVSAGLMVKKVFPAFLMAFTTASSVAAFSTTSETCKKKLGIDPALCDFGLPLAMTLHRPIITIHFTLTVFCFASRYGVAASPVWLIMAVLIAAAMTIAAPPVAGGGAIVFTMMFTQLGIPVAGVGLALAVDLIMDFLNTGLEVSLQTMTLVNAAANLDMLDREALRSPENA